MSVSSVSEFSDGQVVTRLSALIARNGYEIIQVNGQRVYGPPPSLNIPHPPKGTEIFIGKLPRDLYEDEVVPVFERAGKIYNLRLMMDFSGRNRGYGFITFYTQEQAQRAVRLFNGYEIRHRCKIGVYKSVDNCRLFVGNVPTDKCKREIWEALSEVIEGITEIYMYKSHTGEYENRGFVFLEFENHRLAAMARRKLAPGSIIRWGVSLIVDWADPLPEVDPKIMAKVTKLYIRNLHVDLTNDQLWYVLKYMIPSETLIKVHKIRDYAFLHFATRNDAEFAMQILQGKHICGQGIEVTWARPKMYSKTNTACRLEPNFCKSLPPRMRKLTQQGLNCTNHPQPTNQNRPIMYSNLFVDLPEPDVNANIDGAFGFGVLENGKRDCLSPLLMFQKLMI